MPRQMVVEVRVRARWWLWPYLKLTRLGVWLGLPISMDVVRADVRRGLKIEVIRKWL